MTGPNRDRPPNQPVGAGPRACPMLLNLRPGALNLRRPPTHQQPISIEPSNPLEAILIERLRRLDADIQELKTRVNWLILAIVGACLTFIFKTLLG